MDRFDIQLEDGVLLINNSDVVWGISDQQHVQDTINAAPGWWKENSADGVNVRYFLSSQGQEQVLARKITIQLQSDLYTVTNPYINFDSTGKLTINPNATI